MIYLIFGDVHGNLPALEKLLKLEKNNYDQIICHGDVVNYGPWSNECVELLASIPGTVTLKGNHEESFLKGAYLGTHPVATTFFEFCYSSFSQQHIVVDYGDQYDLEEYKICHTIDGIYFYPDTDLANYNIDNNYIIGHSHYQFDRFAGRNRLVNTGSIGQNREFIDVAEYIIYDDIAPQTIYLKSFVYNVDYVIRKMESMCYPQLCLNYYKNKRRYK